MNITAVVITAVKKCIQTLNNNQKNKRWLFNELS